MLFIGTYLKRIYKSLNVIEMGCEECYLIQLILDGL
jgi:hypothetical protein